MDKELTWQEMESLHMQVLELSGQGFDAEIIRDKLFKGSTQKKHLEFIQDILNFEYE